jgi:hypothetical protein
MSHSVQYIQQVEYWQYECLRNGLAQEECAMQNVFRLFLITFALAPPALAQDGDKPKAPETKAETKKEEDPKPTSVPGGGALGMSIVGNHEAPKALVLVPWKPSEPGKAPEILTKADDSKSPIDKEVFMRMLHYQQIAKTNAERKQ